VLIIINLYRGKKPSWYKKIKGKEIRGIIPQECSSYPYLKKSSSGDLKEAGEKRGCDSFPIITVCHLAGRFL